MMVTVYVARKIEIPDERLSELEYGARTNKRHIYPHNNSVAMESIVEEAQARGLVELPNEWHLDADCPTVKGGRLLE